MPTNPPKRQPRLKESCDRCSVAKVRCNKDKPSCSRCAQKGLPCGYSYSRRAGRRTTSSISSMAAMIERSDSCTSSPHMSHSHSPSLASISPHLSASPGDMSDDSDIFPEMWSFPSTIQPNQMPNSMPQQFGWDQDFYNITNTFDQPFGFPAPIPGDQSLIASMDMSTTGMEAFPAFNTAPNHSLSMAPNTSDVHRTSTTSTLTTDSDSSQADAVQDELANLTDFADTMEKKFDAVVRQRMQYRDVYSEFGVPVDEMDLSNPETFQKMRQESNGDGNVPNADLSELSMYYSLAELKRRLKWLREDVGNLVVQPCEPAFV